MSERVVGLVSVVIPAYNHARSISFCLESIFAQTYPSVEVIVVDDGSNDDLERVLLPYREKILFVRQENGGAPRARNAGFALAKGEFVIFCDADVIMRPYMLEREVAALRRHPGAAFAYSPFWFGWKKFRPPQYSAERLRARNFVHTTALLRSVDFPGFDPSLKRFQDWDLWLTLADKGREGVRVRGTLFKVRIDGDSRIGSKWLPRFLYAIPWHWLPWKPKRIVKYDEAREIVMRKHSVDSKQ